MLRVDRTTYPDNTMVTKEYFGTGLLKKTSGSRAYPVEYAYDSQGRLESMKTWTNVATGSPALTQWQYDAYRGFMTNKVYANGTNTGYSYTSSGGLQSRTWARGIVPTYGYSSAGELETVNYSDTTPCVTNTYDRLGRLSQVNQGTNITRKTHDLAGRLTGESFNNFAGFNRYDALLRRAVTTNQPAISDCDIGNRRTAKSGGDASGNGLRTEQYTVNELNQYTQRTVQGRIDILGTASTNATVFVNRTNTTRCQLRCCQGQPLKIKFCGLEPIL